MNTAFTLSVCLLIITALIGVFSLLFSQPDNAKDSSNPEKKNRGFPKWLFTVITTLIIVSLIISIWLLSKQTDEKDDAIQVKKAELSLQQKHYDTTLWKIDTANANLQSTLNSVNKVQLDLRTVSDTINRQVLAQQNIYLATQKLLADNQILLEKNKEVFYNTENSISPLFPMTIKIRVMMPFDDPQIASFVEYCGRIKQGYETDSVLKLHYSLGLDIKNENLEGLQFDQLPDSLEPNLTVTTLFKNIHFNFLVVKGSIKEAKYIQESPIIPFLDPEKWLKNIGKPHMPSKIPQMHFSTHSLPIGKETKVIVNYKYRYCIFYLIYHNCRSADKSNILLNAKELINTQLVVDSYSMNQSHIQEISFYGEKGVAQHITVRFSEKDITSTRLSKKIYLHTITEADYYRSTSDILRPARAGM